MHACWRWSLLDYNSHLNMFIFIFINPIHIQNPKYSCMFDQLSSLDFFSRDSDLTTSVVIQGCGYVKSRVWLCAKRCGYVWPKPQRCGYVQKGVVMCDQNLNTPLRSQTENGVAGVVMCKMVWLCVINKSNQTEHHKAS